MEVSQVEMSECEPVMGRLGSQYRHSFEVPGHRNERPLTAHRSQPAQQELAIAHHRLDDAKHRLHSLLAQAVELAPLNRLEPVLHALYGASRCRQRRRFSEARLPMRMVRIAPGSEQRFNVCRQAENNVGRTEEAVVRQQMFRST